MSDEDVFRVIDGAEEPVHRAAREAVLGGVRRYRGADGLEALIPETIVERLNRWRGGARTEQVRHEPVTQVVQPPTDEALTFRDSHKRLTE